MRRVARLMNIDEKNAYSFFEAGLEAGGNGCSDCFGSAGGTDTFYVCANSQYAAGWERALGEADRAVAFDSSVQCFDAGFYSCTSFSLFSCLPPIRSNISCRSTLLQRALSNRYGWVTPSALGSSSSFYAGRPVYILRQKHSQSTSFTPTFDQYLFCQSCLFVVCLSSYGYADVLKGIRITIA